MYTSNDLHMLRNAIGGALIPGIDTSTGDQLSTNSLVRASSIKDGPGYYYDPKYNRVIVYENGAKLSGIDFGSAYLDIAANNVSVTDCTFEPTSYYYAVIQYGSGATIQNCTFTGAKYSTPTVAFVTSKNFITLKNNTFIDAPEDAVDVRNGVVTGNYFSGAGYMKGAHADAIWISATTDSMSITNNFIDWTNNPDAAVGTNNAIRITGELGNTNDVTVSGNYLLGGTYPVLASNSTAGTLSNVSITRNYVGFGQYGAYYPTTASVATVSGNTIFDWRNPSFSASAWSAYLQTGGLTTTPTLIASSGGDIRYSSTKPASLYGGGYAVHLFSTSLAETNYVGGYGPQYFFMGTGANIVTELSVSDSSAMTGVDYVAGFDPAKDVIDLSRIDANLTQASVQNFAFIGTSTFSGTGAQVRYYQDPANNLTWVQAKLAGDASADMTISLSGLLTLTSANFALTPTASTADASAAAAMTVSHSSSGTATEWSYSNVKGRPYSAYTNIWDGARTWGGSPAAQDFVLSSTSSQLALNGSNVTVNRESGAESINVGTGHFAQTYDANETTQIKSGAGAETFYLGLHFGGETISGFSASGATADTVAFPVAAFSYLNSTMSQAQDLAAVLAKASSATSGITIRDSYGDALTLTGMTGNTLAASSAIRFV